MIRSHEQGQCLPLPAGQEAHRLLLHPVIQHESWIAQCAGPGRDGLALDETPLTVPAAAWQDEQIGLTRRGTRGREVFQLNGVLVPGSKPLLFRIDLKMQISALGCQFLHPRKPLSKTNLFLAVSGQLIVPMVGGHIRENKAGKIAVCSATHQITDGGVSIWKNKNRPLYAID